MNRDFIVTKEHRRFTEFAGAIRKDVTIGICHGEAGVGKTQSARRYAHWDTLEPFIQAWGPRSEADFDPGSKFHVADNTPYMRYFLAHVLQFQFQRARMQPAAGIPKVDSPTPLLGECAPRPNSSAG